MKIHPFLGRSIIIAGFLLATLLKAQAQIVINEIMQSNVSCIMDDLNDFPDSWVELFNSSTEDINLEGYAIGEDSNYERAYRLPNKVITPMSYTLVYLDKVGEGMHADFRLDSGKGALWLFDTTGHCVDHISYKKMPSFDVSYGRLAKDPEKWGYQLEPTPGRANTSEHNTTVITAVPKFDVTGGLYEAPFDLTISLEEHESLPDDARLVISTDGRWPTESKGNTVTMRIASTTLVRARIISDSQIDGPVITQSYIFHPEPTDLAVVSIVSEPDYFYSPVIGIFEGSDGHTVQNSNNWRRPINIEYYGGPNHECLINQISETKVKGNWSRGCPQKSLALYANKRFGTKRFNTTGIWPDKPGVTAVKSFELRNGGQRFLEDHLCDQFAHRIGGVGSKHLDWSAYRPVICYINGSYHGLYDLRERCNEDNIEANYNGFEQIDMVTDWIELDTGDLNAIAELQYDFGRQDISFASLCEAMDVDGFVDMFILQWVLGNTDFPAHNIVSWRYQTGDRRWRWMLKDLDCIGVDGAEGDYIYFINEPVPSFTKVKFPQCGKAFSIFLNCEEGREILIPRLMTAMGDYLREDRAIAMIEEMADEIAQEYRRHLERFFPDDDKYTYEYWLDQVECRKNERRGREKAIIRHLRKHFGYDKTFSLSINTNGIPVSISGQELRHPDFLGNWFFNQPLEIESSQARSWDVVQTSRSGQHSAYTILDDKIHLFIDSKDVVKVDITPNIAPATVYPIQFSTSEEYYLYSMTGTLIKVSDTEENCLIGLPTGLYICKRGSQRKKLVVR